MEHSIVVSNARENFIVVTHVVTDSGSWIVRRWKKIWWFKKRISSNWFTNKEQAVAFANELTRTFEGSDSLHRTEGKH